MSESINQSINQSIRLTVKNKYLYSKFRHTVKNFELSALDGGEWTSSRSSRFTPRERAPGTHWIRGVQLYLHSPNTPSWRAAQLKHRDKFTFYFNTYHASQLISKQIRTVI